ncbi:hypothetical protein HYH02_000451 [Chlamydomonas schloesseri]|uniref:Uncharacterized protein n=1 Tax=Chlamydomonas schloesseri TaxID=2026947 RepID=A0A836BDF4_9CHLO|nr:hypothetical protein HYH02_000451 [Chlamydomonas schloesseri]|eukprot:KAG2454610.1 hypothetical protein HYH02_000451 [Chlamydomonas schloesseri]
MAQRFRPALQRAAPQLEPVQMMTVLAAGSSLGLEPPSADLLKTLCAQVERLARDPHPLAPAAAVEVAYMVMQWAPQVAMPQLDTLRDSAAEGLQYILRRRLAALAPAAAPKFALLLPTLGVQLPGAGLAGADGSSSGGGPGSSSSSSVPSSRERADRQSALRPLVAVLAEGLGLGGGGDGGAGEAATGGHGEGQQRVCMYDTSDCADALMGLGLAGVAVPVDFTRRVVEVTREQLAAAAAGGGGAVGGAVSARSLAALLTGLAEQRRMAQQEDGAPYLPSPDAPPFDMPASYAAAVWGAARRLARPEALAAEAAAAFGGEGEAAEAAAEAAAGAVWDVNSAATFLRGAVFLGSRPDAETTQAMLECVLGARYREAPDPAALATLVQVLAAMNYAPPPAWAAEARAALASSLGALPAEVRDSVLRTLQASGSAAAAAASGIPMGPRGGAGGGAARGGSGSGSGVGKSVWGSKLGRSGSAGKGGRRSGGSGKGPSSGGTRGRR